MANNLDKIIKYFNLVIKYNPKNPHGYWKRAYYYLKKLKSNKKEEREDLYIRAISDLSIAIKLDIYNRPCWRFLKKERESIY